MSTRILGILMSRGFLLKDIQLTFLNGNLFWSKSGAVSGGMVAGRAVGRQMLEFWHGCVDR